MSAYSLPRPGVARHRTHGHGVPAKPSRYCLPSRAPKTVSQRPASVSLRLSAVNLVGMAIGIAEENLCRPYEHSQVARSP